MAGRLFRFLGSLDVSLWLVGALSLSLLCGAFVMPGNEAFQSIHALPLFDWMGDQTAGDVWWLWLSIAVLAGLTVNTVVCSIISVIRKRSAVQLLLFLSPQVIHLGFLFMLLAHLLSGLGGFKGTVVAEEGASFLLPGGGRVEVGDITLSLDRQGYLRDWGVGIVFHEGAGAAGAERILPNKPVFHGGVGVYVKDLRALPRKMVLLELSREPGAVWALVGGCLFMAGTITLLMLRIRGER
jgi:hypothetical protein